MNRSRKIMIAVFLSFLQLLRINEVAAAAKSRTQSDTSNAAAFVARLRAFDLNQETQNGYALTAKEYQQLLSTWNDLPRSDQLALLHDFDNEWGQSFFVNVLFLDLNNRTLWEKHFPKMVALGATGLSLTLSQDRTPVRVQQARALLVDLLQHGAPMLHHDSLVISELIKTQAEKRAGISARRRIEQWERLINDYRLRSTWDKLNAVNLFFYRLIAVKDDDGTDNGYDYWQSPLETLARGAGDCDDFAMAKYVSLRLMGIPFEQLRVGIVTFPHLSAHAVLLFFPPGEEDPWVLDNLPTLEHGVIRKNEILRLSRRMALHGFQPAFGINEAFWTVFENGLHERKQPSEPRSKFRKFRLALLNSQRLLPAERSALTK